MKNYATVPLYFYKGTTMDVKPKKVFFTLQFLGWLKSLRDTKAAAKIKARLKRVEESGSLGDWKYLDFGVSEFRLGGRGGYRIYFGEIEEGILILSGGHHDTQSRNIEQAKGLLADYEQRKDFTED